MSRKPRGGEAAEVALPVTPMLDMTFQLMFFFIATYKPITALEGQMEMALPSKSDIAAKTQAEVAPKESNKEEIDVPSVFTVILRSQRGQGPELNGLISSISVRDNAGTDALQGDTINEKFNALRAKLKGVQDVKLDKNKVKETVRVEADGNMRWSEVVRVMDICTEVGFQVSFIAPPPE